MKMQSISIDIKPNEMIPVNISLQINQRNAIAHTCLHNFETLDEAQEAIDSLFTSTIQGGLIQRWHENAA